MKKKMLILCDFFLPSVKAGGPLRSITSIIRCLKQDVDMIVATRNHELGEKEPFQNIVSDQLQKKEHYQVIYLSPNNIVSGIRQLIQQYHFDVIYLNSFFSPKISVRTLFYLKRHAQRKIRVIISPRGELGEGALSIKKMRKKLFLFLFRYFFHFSAIEWHAASHREAEDINNTTRLSHRITTLSNMVLYVTPEKPINLKQKNHLNIVFLSRISQKKNLDFALQVLALVKGNVSFDIYGLVQEAEYWERCAKQIESLPRHIEVSYRGECHPEKVIQQLKNYDLFFLPTLNENYGYAIVEALASGCPVLLSNQTPWYDLTEKNAGWMFDLSQPTDFVDKIDQLVLMDSAQYHFYKQHALNYYLHHIANHSLEEQYRLFFVS